MNTNTKTQSTEIKAHALDMLRKLTPEGSTVYTVLRSVSASGLTRRIDLYTIHEGALTYLSGYVEHVGIGRRAAKGQGLVVRGCGMDMGFHLVYNLSYALYGADNALKHAWI